MQCNWARIGSKHYLYNAGCRDVCVLHRVFALSALEYVRARERTTPRDGAASLQRFLLLRRFSYSYLFYFARFPADTCLSSRSTLCMAAYNDIERFVQLTSVWFRIYLFNRLSGDRCRP